MINLSVVREHVDKAFSVNLKGVYTLIESSIVNKVNLFINTAPVTLHRVYDLDNFYEYDLDENVPERSGFEIYPLSKKLGNSLLDFYEDNENINIITFLISRIRFSNKKDGRNKDIVVPFSISWDDLAKAFVCAIKNLKQIDKHEKFYITTNLPMGKYTSRKAFEYFNWEPTDKFENYYRINE